MSIGPFEGLVAWSPSKFNMDFLLLLINVFGLMGILVCARPSCRSRSCFARTNAVLRRYRPCFCAWPATDGLLSRKVAVSSTLNVHQMGIRVQLVLDNHPKLKQQDTVKGRELLGQYMHAFTRALTFFSSQLPNMHSSFMTPIRRTINVASATVVYSNETSSCKS